MLRGWSKVVSRFERAIRANVRSTDVFQRKLRCRSARVYTRRVHCIERKCRIDVRRRHGVDRSHIGTDRSFTSGRARFLTKGL